MFTNSNKVLPLATPLIRHGNLAVFVFFCFVFVVVIFCCRFVSCDCNHFRCDGHNFLFKKFSILNRPFYDQFFRSIHAHTLTHTPVLQRSNVLLSLSYAYKSHYIILLYVLNQRASTIVIHPQCCKPYRDGDD